MNLLTKDFVHEGWLWKTGPKPTDAYKKRWFTLDQRKLMYHEEPLVISKSYYVKVRDEAFTISCVLYSRFSKYEIEQLFVFGYLLFLTKHF